eukprot:scaffold21778_cov131-Isochrysis_galbana.AAC.1
MLVPILPPPLQQCRTLLRLTLLLSCDCGESRQSGSLARRFLLQLDDLSPPDRPAGSALARQQQLKLVQLPCQRVQVLGDLTLYFE